MGLRGRNAAGNWLGSSSRLRTYGSRSTYGSPTWKRQPSRPLAGLHPSTLGQVRKEAAGEQGGGSSSAVFEILSNDSEDETGASPPRVVGVGGGSSSVGGSGVGPRSGRDSMVATTATSSSFDVDDWSDSSNERQKKKNSRNGIEARGARVTTCQLQSLTSRRGGDDGVAPSRLDKQPRRPPSPCPPPVAAKAKSRSPSPPRGVGPRSGWSSKVSLVAQAAPAATAAATTVGTKTAIGQRPGQAIGGVASRAQTGRSSKSKEACERRVGVRPERSSSPVAVGRQQGRGASGGAGAGALRAPVGSGGGARARVGGVKEPATRRALGAEGSDREGNWLAEKTASRSVFDLDDEDESD